MDPIESIKQSTLPTLWQHLPYAELIEFGKTSKEYNRILENPETWIYLIKRDFNIDSNPKEAKDFYELLYLVLPDYFYIEEPADQICPVCRLYTGVKTLEKYQGVCFGCWYDRPDNRCVEKDEIILNRLQKIAIEQPHDPQTCSVIKMEDGIPKVKAMIKGINIFDIIIKVVLNIEMERFKRVQNGDYGLTAYMRQKIVDHYEEGEGFSIKSLFEILTIFRNEWVDSYDVYQYVIQRVDNVSIY